MGSGGATFFLALSSKGAVWMWVGGEAVVGGGEVIRIVGLGVDGKVVGAGVLVVGVGVGGAVVVGGANVMSTVDDTTGTVSIHECVRYKKTK
jgi:hypothetical protein